MHHIKLLKKKIDEMCGFSRTAFMLGAIMTVNFYIVGITAYIIAPKVPNYMGALSVFRGSLEAAPASLVAGICAAIICDLVSKSHEKDK